MKNGYRNGAMVLASLLFAVNAQATPLYWDTNGTSAGAGGTPTGTWDGVNALWNSDSSGAAGGSFTATTTGSDDLTIVAGASTTSGNSAYTVTLSGTQAANSVTFLSSGAATLTGGTLNLDAGGISAPQFAFGSTARGAVTIASAVALQADTTVSNAGTGALTMNGVISGGFGITKTGSGNLLFGGAAANTYTGTTTILNGTVTLSSTTANTGTGSIILGDTSGANSTVFQMTSNGRNITNNIVVAGGNTGAAEIKATGASQNYTSSGTIVLGSGGKGHDLKLTGNGNGFLTLSGIISDAASLTNAAGIVTVASGQVSFSGANTFTGGVVVLSGAAISINNGKAVGTGTLTLNGGGFNQTVGGGSLTQNNLLVFDSDFSYSSGTPAALNLGTGAVDLGALNAGGSNGNATRIITVGTSTSTAGLTVGGVISTGSNGLTTGITKAGTGYLILGGANVYSGATVVNGGTLQLTNGNDRLPTGTTLTIGAGATATTAGGRVDLNTRNQTVAGLTSTTGLGVQGMITNTGATNSTLTVSNSTANQFDGFLLASGGTGALALAKTNSGTLTITGSNTYSGGTTVSGGTLVASGTSVTALADATQTATIGARSQTLTLLTSTSGLVVGQRITGTNIAAGTYITAILSSTSISISNGTLNTNAATASPISFGAFSGSALGSGNNTVGGGGTLLVNGFSGTGTTAVNSTGTLGGTGAMGGAVTLNSGGILAPGSGGAGTLSGTSLTWSAGGDLAFDLGTASDKLALSGALTKSGSGIYQFDITQGSGFAAGTYDLVDFATTTFALSDFSVTGLGGGYTGTFQYDLAGDTLQLAVVAVPEPSTYALLGMGMGALWFLRRKKAKV